MFFRFFSYHNESDDEGSQSSASVPSSGKLTPLNRPPKDYICPITSQLLTDPVTLETGQTYERKAIQEWLQRGNTTCPITRQPLSANALPKTNYVLNRLITSWRYHLILRNGFNNGKDLVEVLGEILEHDDTDSNRTKGQKLDTGFSGTTMQWENTFGSRYWRAGRMYRGVAPSPVTVIPQLSKIESKTVVSSTVSQKLLQLPKMKAVERTSAVNESIELKHEVEALRGQLAAVNTYAERCKTSTLQAKEAYLAIRAEVEELERKMDDLQEERERRTSGELEGELPEAAAPVPAVVSPSLAGLMSEQLQGSSDLPVVGAEAVVASSGDPSSVSILN
ncbi:hypothetical protein IFM89_035059, partial [Coptis chinensis]